MIFSRYYRNRSSSLPCALFKKKFRVESNDEGKHSTVSRRDFLIDLKVEIYKQTNKTKKKKKKSNLAGPSVCVFVTHVQPGVRGVI
jgi:hypothetical protein